MRVADPPPSLVLSYMATIYSMPDFSRVTGFEWYEGNSRKSVDTHGVSQSEAE